MQPLLSQLQALEVELHHPGTPCSRQRLAALLHPEFTEVGRSGRPYDRATVLDFLASRGEPDRVDARDFELVLLAPQVALLTYRSAHAQADGSLHLHTHRSSVWVQGAEGWQLRYHQGTPAAAAW